MALIHGSLMDGIWKGFVKKGLTIGILVIDEQTPLGNEDPNDPAASLKVKPLIRNQQKLLAHAQYLGCPTWCIELNATIGKANEKETTPTNIRLRGLLPADTPVITKRSYSAFEGTDLKDQLKSKFVRAVVVLGFETNFCVKFSAVGGFPDHACKLPFQYGATQLGFPVLSCDQILNGIGPAKWWNEKSVFFYTGL